MYVMLHVGFALEKMGWLNISVHCVTLLEYQNMLPLKYRKNTPKHADINQVVVAKFDNAAEMGTQNYQ